jgi:hypothetical protein
MEGNFNKNSKNQMPRGRQSLEKNSSNQEKTQLAYDAAFGNQT